MLCQLICEDYTKLLPSPVIIYSQNLHYDIIGAFILDVVGLGDGDEDEDSV